jgi:hypothetical protein
MGKKFEQVETANDVDVDFIGMDDNLEELFGQVSNGHGKKDHLETPLVVEPVPIEEEEVPALHEAEDKKPHVTESLGIDQDEHFEVFMKRLAFGDMNYIQHNLTSQMAREVQVRGMKNMSRTANLSGYDTRQFVHAKSLRDQPIDLHVDEKIFENMQVAPDSIRTVCGLVGHTDADCNRAFIFAQLPLTIFFLPGTRDIKLVPGLQYSFIGSMHPTTGGKISTNEDPLHKVYEKNFPPMYRVMYINKKSLRWSSLPANTDMVLSLFNYIRDMLLMKDYIKDAKRSMPKKGRGGKGHNWATVADENSNDGLPFIDDITGGGGLASEAATDIGVDITGESYDNNDMADDDADEGDGLVLKDPVDGEKARNAREVTILFNCDLVISSVIATRDIGYGNGDEDEIWWTRDDIVDIVKENTTVENTIDSTTNKFKDSFDQARVFRQMKGAADYEKTAVALASSPFDHTTGVGRIVSMVLCHDLLAPLYPYYSKKQLIRLPIEHIACISALLRTSPASLCFYSLVAKYTQDSKGRMLSNLKELCEEDYHEICKLYPRTTDWSIEKTAVEIYRMLKDKCVENGDKFVPMWHIFVEMSDITKDHFKNAIRYLMECHAICCIANPDVPDKETVGAITKAYPAGKCRDIPDDLVYLTVTRATEVTIVNGIKKMFANYLASPPILASDQAPNEVLRSVKWIPSDDPPMPPYEKCSEQTLLFETIARPRRSPIISLNGWAGSGKTAALRFIVGLLAPNSFLVLTAQATNAAGCRDRVYYNSLTIHMLLIAHCNLCPCSPYFDRFLYSKTQIGPGLPKFNSRAEREKYLIETEQDLLQQQKYCMEALGIRYKRGVKNCFLSSIETIVIDEISLVSDDIFSALMYAMSNCGKLKQIIVCGDHRQKPQISFGCLLDDIRLGFPDSTINFTHCHRASTGLLFKNAEAIHNGEYNQVVFDRQNYFLVPLDSDISSRLSNDEMKDRYREVMRTNDITAKKDNMIITRTNLRRKVISDVIREETYGDSRYYYRGQKIFLRVSDTDVGFVSKQILVISHIEDVQISGGVRKGTIKRNDAVKLSGEVMDRFDSTKDAPRDYRSTLRRIVAVPLGKSMDDVTKHVKIPHFGKFSNLIHDASCLTSYFVQGLETNHVIIDQAAFWEKADNRRVMFTCVTRASDTVTFLSTPEILEKWCNNRYEDRKSIMWYYFVNIAKDCEDHMRADHTKRRRELLRLIKKSGSMNGMTETSFELCKDPLGKDLHIPPSKKAKLVAAQEGGKYDADAILAKQRDLDAKILRKMARDRIKMRNKRKRAAEGKELRDEKNRKLD